MAPEGIEQALVDVAGRIGGVAHAAIADVAQPVGVVQQLVDERRVVQLRQPQPQAFGSHDHVVGGSC